MRWGEALVILLIFVGLAVMGYIGYTYGHDAGLKKGHDLGYSEGYIAGNSSGYALGFTNGNSTGYLLGYAVGNGSGYAYGYFQGNITGYEIGYNDGYLKGLIDGAVTSYDLRDPSFLEVIWFLSSDKTDQNKYTSSYTCINFAADVKNNAFAAGYRCGLVYIKFKDTFQTIVCFNTTNYGLVFVEPQYDDIVTLTIGQSYAALNGYVKPNYDDKILSYIIIW